jgi:DNA-binding MarR family transcriptional regulator
MDEQLPRATTSPEVDALVRVSFAIFAVLTRAAVECDLSVTQVRLLGILRDRTPTMAAIAEFLRLDRSSISGLIDRAERRGLVARQASADDGRVTHIRLTPTGWEIGERVAAIVNSETELLIAGVSATERSRLIRLAETIVGAEADQRARS